MRFNRIQTHSTITSHEPSRVAAAWVCVCGAGCGTAINPRALASKSASLFLFLSTQQLANTANIQPSSLLLLLSFFRLPHSCRLMFDHQVASAQLQGCTLPCPPFHGVCSSTATFVARERSTYTVRENSTDPSWFVIETKEPRCRQMAERSPRAEEMPFLVCILQTTHLFCID